MTYWVKSDAYFNSIIDDAVAVQLL